MPQEAWSGIKPSIEHLEHYKKGYRLCDPKTKMVVVIKDGDNVSSNDKSEGEHIGQVDGDGLEEDMEFNSSGHKKILWTYQLEQKQLELNRIFKTRLNELGEGYSQHGIDFIEVFIFAACMETIRMIVALLHLDVKSTFLHGELSEDVYIDQPKGYVKKGKEHKVYKLHKTLHGLRQTPRA
ncbi:hypothetical protein CR513_28384, partial [Mucuna pruriens]